MALTKKKREAIERHWVEDSDMRRNDWGNSEGEPLCCFLRNNGTRVLYTRFDVEVYRGCQTYIDYYFDDCMDNDDDRDDLSYLCRALTLNLLLNHEEKQP